MTEEINLKVFLSVLANMTRAKETSCTLACIDIPDRKYWHKTYHTVFDEITRLVKIEHTNIIDNIIVSETGVTILENKIKERMTTSETNICRKIAMI